MKKNNLIISTFVLLILGADLQARCLEQEQLTMPDGYILSAAKCIGVMGKLSEFQGNNDAVTEWSSQRWIDNARSMDEICGYGNADLSVEEEADFAKVNFVGYVSSQNKVQIQSLVVGCNQLFEAAFDN